MKKWAKLWINLSDLNMIINYCYEFKWKSRPTAMSCREGKLLCLSDIVTDNLHERILDWRLHN